MLDIKFIRQNSHKVQQAIKDRGYSFPGGMNNVYEFLKEDAKLRETLQKIETLRAQQNKIVQEVARLLKAKQDATEQIQQSKKIKEELETLQKDYDFYCTRCENTSIRIPNIPHETVPIGGASKNSVGPGKGK